VRVPDPIRRSREAREAAEADTFSELKDDDRLRFRPSIRGSNIFVRHSQSNEAHFKPARHGARFLNLGDALGRKRRTSMFRAIAISFDRARVTEASTPTTQTIFRIILIQNWRRAPCE
jgi:hypothetical protein